MNQDRPWIALKELVEEGKAEAIEQYLKTLKSDDIASVMSHLNSQERTKLVSVLQPEDAVEVMDDIPWIQALNILEDMDSKEAAAIITEMPSDDQADFLTEMSTADADAIIDEMGTEEAEKVRDLIQYDPETAGGLMITEFLAYEASHTVFDVIRDMKQHAAEYERYNVQYIYVVSKGKFIGVLRMRDLLLTDDNILLSEIVIKDTLTVAVNDSVQDLINFFDTYDFYGVPVVNDQNELLGIVLRKDVLEFEVEKAQTEGLEMQGIVGGEELRTLPVLLRSKRRLSWLSVNILLNIVAASVIAFYQDTLSSVIALAVFLPIISDMSGCSGNQAVAVSLRELSLGVVRPFEVMRVWLQEVKVGLINGLVLGLLIGTAAWLWQGNVYLGLVVGGALAINTLVAVSLGGTIPLILKRFNVDPALASGPILTTVTDMFGFFMALSFAGLALNHLV